MKNIYNITRRQLIMLWGVLFLFFADDSRNEFIALLAFILFFGLIFYTLGWRKWRKLHIHKDMPEYKDAQKILENWGQTPHKNQ